MSLAMRSPFVSLVAALILIPPAVRADPGTPAEPEVRKALHQALTFFRSRVAVHGGYVYYVSLDLQKRLGEGVASAEQIWVQPPGTPAVGMAYLTAYQATGESAFLDAAREAGTALIHGQLRSGGWTNAVDFDPQGSQAAQYRNGKGGGKRNFSTLDDDISQAAMRFLMRLDQTEKFGNEPVHGAVTVALEALLRAQFANGGFPQGWTDAVPEAPVEAARYPDYDWKTEGRIKNYWDMYTLNDGLAGTVAATLVEASGIYGDKRYVAALRKLGDFLLLAQMPEPQPAWAQQYNRDMQPIWARKFEPPAIAGRESQDVLWTLLRIASQVRDARYLQPLPKAMAYLKRSRLPDGRLSRYYELRSNKPLYMSRQGDAYSLTYDDSRLPDHYGWKWVSELDGIEEAYRSVMDRKGLPRKTTETSELALRSAKILATLDGEGRWVSSFAGERLVGQPEFRPGETYLSSALFNENVEVLSEYLMRLRHP